MSDTLIIGDEWKTGFKDKLMNMIPNGANLNLCLTCGACS